jgi:predicted acylesterase/phospholipase RssA
MVAALEQLNLLNSFDAIYGSSAGAISGAYFHASQAR